MNNGLFIALEGDPRQFKLLRERLSAVGYSVETFSFPLLEQGSSHFVRSYTAGDYGPPETVSPYTTTLFYAMDRYETAAKIREALAGGNVVLASRYVGATMAEQGAKFPDPIEQRSFFVWADSLDYQLLNVPRPAINIFIKSAPSSGSERSTNTMAELLCKLFPQDFQSVEGVQEGRPLGIAEVNNRIWNILQPILPPRPDKPGHNVTVRLSEEPVRATKSVRAEPNGSFSLETNLSLAVINDIEQLAPGGVKYSLNWQQVDYDYVTPGNMPRRLQTKYESLLTAIINEHKTMRQTLKKRGDSYQLLDAALPMSARFRVQLELSGEAAQKLIDQFSTDKLDERRQLSRLIENQTNRKPSEGLKDPEKLDDIIARLADQTLHQTLAEAGETVSLIEASPRNEFKIVTESLYPFSSLSRDELDRQIDSWPYVQKEETLRKALAVGKPQLLGDVHYRFDVTADRQLIGRLAGHGADIKTQPPTPRYGYEVPEAIETAGIADQYIGCFDKSLELFSSLQAGGKEEYGVYAVLLGHRQHFQVGCTLGTIKKLRGDNNEHSRAVLGLLVAKVAEAHPIVGAYLSEPQPEKTTTKKSSKRSERRKRTTK